MGLALAPVRSTSHTRGVRAPVLALSAILAICCSRAAFAEPPPGFWQRMAASQENELRDVLKHARQLLDSAERPILDAEDDQLRQRMLREAHGMLRFGLRQAPDNRELLELMAFVEEAAGRRESALARYRDLLERADHYRTSTHACTRYGLYLARLSQLGPARAVLGRCIGFADERQYGNGSEHRDLALLNLGNLHAAEGDLTRGIELLEREKAADNSGLLPFALVVLYDKDERLSDAYELLERLARTYDNRYPEQVARALGTAEFIPAPDRHYYTALLLEVRGSLPEAREEWHHYLRSGPQARYRERAQQHLEAVDELLANPPPVETEPPRRPTPSSLLHP